MGIYVEWGLVGTVLVGLGLYLISVVITKSDVDTYMKIVPETESKGRMRVIDTLHIVCSLESAQ